MSMYELPKFKWPKLKALKFQRFWRNRGFIIFLIILVSFVFGGIGGAITGSYFYSEVKDYLSKLKIEIPEAQKIVEKEKVVEKEYLPQTTQEERIIQVVENVSPAVVSIVVTKEMPIYIGPFEFEIPGGTEKEEISGGTGFIVSEEGMILTNRHVVLEEEADYTVLTNDGKEYSAKVLARDSFRDLAVIKIEGQEPFPTAKLGDSDSLQIGQTVIAIGNALGEFRNTVSAGVISGLGRTVTASGGGIIETLEDVIQTDAAINRGNSGGPLLNLKGEVIGVNFAMAEAAENIGFAIPINKAKKDIEQVKTLGKIVYPYLGVYYCLITESVQKEYSLSVDYGAWIGRDRYCRPYEESVIPGSAAEKAGLKDGDIILEFDGETITAENSLAKIIQEYDLGDKVVLKILREGRVKILQATLGELSE